MNITKLRHRLYKQNFQINNALYNSNTTFTRFIFAIDPKPCLHLIFVFSLRFVSKKYMQERSIRSFRIISSRKLVATPPPSHSSKHVQFYSQHLNLSFLMRKEQMHIRNCLQSIFLHLLFYTDQIPLICGVHCRLHLRSLSQFAQSMDN